MARRARRLEVGDIVYIDDYADPRAQLEKYTLLCPDCGREMRICQGDIVSAYFRHQKRCPYVGWSEPGTPEHDALESAVFTWILRDDHWGGVYAECEVICKRACRKADVLVYPSDDRRLAIECQISHITLREIELRTRCYAAAGIEVIWIFESNLLRRCRRWAIDWLLAHQGVVFEAYLGKADKSVEEKASDYWVALWAWDRNRGRPLFPVTMHGPLDPWPWDRCWPDLWQQYEQRSDILLRISLWRTLIEAADTVGKLGDVGSLIGKLEPSDEAREKLRELFLARLQALSGRDKGE